MFIEFLKTPVGILTISADNHAIMAIQLEDKTAFKEIKNRLTQECKKQLKEYFAGKRKIFDLPLKIEGTKFQKAVWKELLQIPYGKTCSYSDIAMSIGCPNAQRAVGTANRVNSLPIVIPCHRVISKNRKLAGYGLGLDKKKWLLQHEGKMMV